jgi:hypothetical protein
VVSETGSLGEAGDTTKMGTWELLKAIVDILVSGEGRLRVEAFLTVVKLTVEPLLTT